MAAQEKDCLTDNKLKKIERRNKPLRDHLGLIGTENETVIYWIMEKEEVGKDSRSKLCEVTAEETGKQGNKK